MPTSRAQKEVMRGGSSTSGVQNTGTSIKKPGKHAGTTNTGSSSKPRGNEGVPNTLVRK